MNVADMNDAQFAAWLLAHKDDAMVRAVRIDVMWFKKHPGETVFERDYIPGEFENDTDTEEVNGRRIRITRKAGHVRREEVK